MVNNVLSILALSGFSLDWGFGDGGGGRLEASFNIEKNRKPCTQEGLQR